MWTVDRKYLDSGTPFEVIPVTPEQIDEGKKALLFDVQWHLKNKRWFTRREDAEAHCKQRNEARNHAIRNQLNRHFSVAR